MANSAVAPIIMLVVSNCKPKIFSWNHQLKNVAGLNLTASWSLGFSQGQWGEQCWIQSLSSLLFKLVDGGFPPWMNLQPRRTSKCNPPACRRVWLWGVVLVSVLVLYLFLFLACTCSFVLFPRVFASSESKSPPLPPLFLFRPNTYIGTCMSIEHIYMRPSRLKRYIE